jgi:hypothetical protein
MHHTDDLLATIQALPPARIAEIEDFVALVVSREQNQALSQAAACASEASFAAIWDNAADGAYDALRIW